MKTRVLIVSKTFQQGHPKAGKSTNFREKILSGEKIHTIRNNDAFWESIVKEVMQGKSILSLREWTGKPYASKQEEFLKLDLTSGIGYESVFISNKLIYIGNKFVACDNNYRNVPKNNGLSVEDFWGWFANKPQFANQFHYLIMIHFTYFRYNNPKYLKL